MSRTPRPIRIEGDVAYIPLTKGYEVVIDAADVTLVDGVCWCASVRRRADGSIRTVYAVHNTRVDGRIKTTLLHRRVARVGGLVKVDHKDCDGLNNRSANLRLATDSENSHNSRLPCNNKSGVKGVSWCPSRRKWVVKIAARGRNLSIGRFESLESAALARAIAVAKLHGDFARLG